MGPLGDRTQRQSDDVETPIFHAEPLKGPKVREGRCLLWHLAIWPSEITPSVHPLRGGATFFGGFEGGLFLSTPSLDRSPALHTWP